MTLRDDKSGPILGFLTVLRDAECGLFGGYLLLNRLGRPLEFHCTAPIRPNRAQEILYGPTLEPFLYGEQIGLTLLRQAKAPARIVCTDQPPVLALRALVDTPVALVLPRDAQDSELNTTLPRPMSSSPASPDRSSDARQWHIDGPHRGGPRLHVFAIGAQRLAVAESASADRDTIIAALASLASQAGLTNSAAPADAPDLFDLDEPFGRIREAIDEARRGGPQR